MRAVVDLALGSSYTCALFDDGALRCWGASNAAPRDGEAWFGDDEAASDAPLVALRGPALSMGGGGGGSQCALLADNRPTCWGANNYGQLGNGTNVTLSPSENLEPLARFGSPVTEIEIAYHTCAVLDGGALYCWGLNIFGALGLGSYAYPGQICGNCSDEPCCVGNDESIAGIPPVDVGAPAAQVAIGDAPDASLHTCVLTTAGAVRCWGTAMNGAHGLPGWEDLGDYEPPSLAPDVAVGGFVEEIDAGAQTTCVRLQDGAVRCWGINEHGLGYGTGQDIGDDETPGSAGDVPLHGKATQIAVGTYHRCALLEDGNVHCWGDTDFGDLGLGFVPDDCIGDDEPADAAPLVDLGGRAVLVRAGLFHTCALLDTGAVRCWGANEDGQLGYGHTEPIGDDESPASAGDVPVD